MRWMSFSIVLFLLGTSIANAQVCPNSANIKAVGFNFIIRTDENLWQATWWPDHQYGTEVNWRFAMAVKTSGDKDEAMGLAKKGLETLRLFTGPIENDDVTLCYYTTENQMMAIAVSPPEAM